MAGSAFKMNNSTIIYVGIIIVVVAIAAILLTGKSYSAPTTTTISHNLTTVTVAPIPTTIVPNLTVATGPNLASCNGYNVSISTANRQVVGSCNWISGLMNITVYGGSFQNAVLKLVQQNITSAPYNVSTTAASCRAVSGVVYIPGGNYKVTLQTSAVPQGACGSATVRLSH